MIEIRRGLETEGKRAADLGLSAKEVAFYDAIWWRQPRALHEYADRQRGGSGSGEALRRIVGPG
jgi:hypothetical protein